MTLRHTVSLGVTFMLVTALTTFSLEKLVFSTSLPAQAASKDTLSFDNEPTDRSPETYQGSFLFNTTQEMLDALAVRVYPEDKVFAFPDPELGLGSHLRVYRAQPVLIKDGTLEKLVRTWSSTVEQILTEQSIELEEKDAVEPDKQDLIQVGSELPVITITRVEESQVSTTQTIDYKTEYKDDSELEKGIQKTEQIGKKGTLKKTYLIHKENNKEVSRKLVDQTVTKEPVAEIIRRGTKIVSYGSGQASWYGGVPAMTAAHRTLPMGTKVKVINVATGSSVVVTIADRGPFIAGRVIDLSGDAFSKIASKGSGVASVRLEKAE